MDRAELDVILPEMFDHRVRIGQQLVATRQHQHRDRIGGPAGASRAIDPPEAEARGVRKNVVHRQSLQITSPGTSSSRRTTAPVVPLWKCRTIEKRSPPLSQAKPIRMRTPRPAG